MTYVLIPHTIFQLFSMTNTLTFKNFNVEFCSDYKNLKGADYAHRLWDN